MPQPPELKPPESSTPPIDGVLSPVLVTVGEVFQGVEPQGWLARSVLASFGLGVMIYLYFGTWVLPGQMQHWAEVQPQIDRLKTTSPHTLQDMEQQLADLKTVIDQLRQISPLAGTLYPRAHAKAESLQTQYEQLQHRAAIETLGQQYLSTAKRLAAQATLILETGGVQSEAEHRLLQQKWLQALYWLNQVPSQTFAATDTPALLHQYHRQYRQLQQGHRLSP